MHIERACQTRPLHQTPAGHTCNQLGTLTQATSRVSWPARYLNIRAYLTGFESLPVSKGIHLLRIRRYVKKGNIPFHPHTPGS